MIKKYFFIFSKSFKSKICYKKFLLSQISFSLLSLLVQYSLWFSLLISDGSQSIIFKDMVVYLLISQMVRNLVYVDVAGSIESKVREGSITLNFLLPISLKSYLIFDELGSNFFKVITTTFPAFIISYFIIGFTLPSTIISGALFLLALILGMLIMIEIQYIVGLLAFVLQRTWFLGLYIEAGLDLFGGAHIPLWFYPHGLVLFSNILPFRYIIFVPMNFYLGKITYMESGGPLIIATSWCIGLLFIEKIVWTKVNKIITINGG